MNIGTEFFPISLKGFGLDLLLSLARFVTFLGVACGKTQVLLSFSLLENQIP